MDRLSFKEYELLLKAHRLKQADEDLKIYNLAWQIQRVKATRNKGKEPYFKKFKNFYDYEKRIKEILDPPKPKKYSSYREYVKRKEAKNGN